MEAIIRSTKVRVAALATSAMLAIGLLAAPSASAQQEGLINVDISNVLNHNQVVANVPITAAANICGTEVGLLSAQLENGPVTCTAGANNAQMFTITQH